MIKRNIEPLKNEKLNILLENISNNIILSDDDKKFLDAYEKTHESDVQSYHRLSKQATYYMISNLLEKNKKVICNLEDRDGAIMSPIISIELINEKCIINNRNGISLELSDRFMFNIDYHSVNTYSLYTYDEFHEKVYI